MKIDAPVFYGSTIDCDVHSGEKAEEAAKEKVKQPKVDYLSVSRNVAENQLTVSSITSGNLALYEVFNAINILRAGG